MTGKTIIIDDVAYEQTTYVYGVARNEDGELDIFEDMSRRNILERKVDEKTTVQYDATFSIMGYNQKNDTLDCYVTLDKITRKEVPIKSVIFFPIKDRYGSPITKTKQEMDWTVDIFKAEKRGGKNRSFIPTIIKGGNVCNYDPGSDEFNGYFHELLDRTDDENITPGFLEAIFKPIEEELLGIYQELRSQGKA